MQNCVCLRCGLLRLYRHFQETTADDAQQLIDRPYIEVLPNTGATGYVQIPTQSDTVYSTVSSDASNQQL